MALTAGTRLGPYEIQSALGAGGMGEVYRALDTRLNRTVAVKVLPSSLSADPQFRERFDREARAISQLDHPHICTLYDVGDENGLSFLVMQYLEGQTLADRLAKGRMPLEEAVTIAGHILEALDNAHRAGIVHRDLKPGNIMLTSSGAKLLDFGLAKQRAVPADSASIAPWSGAPEDRRHAAGPPEGGRHRDLTAAPTVNAPLTAQGTILGTVQYMAPEQIEGEDADPRSDIFAFGAVFYEMLTGRKAFEGKSAASLIGAILKDNPSPISTGQPIASRALDRLVSRCLAKSRDDRWQTARDLLAELRWVSAAPQTSGSTGTALVRRSRTPWLVSAALGLLLIASVVIVVRRARESPTFSPMVRFQVTVPSITGGGGSAAISPDGRQIIFSAASALWVRSLDSASLREIRTVQQAASLAWSPDGRRVAFATGDRSLRTIDLSTGSVATVGSYPGVLGGLVWGPDDNLIYAVADEPGISGLYSVGVRGGMPRMFVKAQRPGQVGYSDAFGRVVFLERTDQSVNVCAAALSGERAGCAGLAADGLQLGGTEHLVFSRGATIFAQRFDPRTATLAGEPVQLADQVAGNIAGRGLFAVSAGRGTQVLSYFSGASQQNNQFAWMDRTGRRLGDVGEPNNYQGFDLSPDGRFVIASRVDLAGASAWVIDVSRGVATRASATDVAMRGDVVWAPDGRRYAFLSSREEAAYEHPAFGGVPKLVRRRTERMFGLEDWSKDGRFLAVLTQDQAERRAEAMPIDGSAPLVLARGSGLFDELHFSPDGRWAAYNSNESGRHEVYVTPIPPTGERWQVSPSGGVQGRWRGDGRELYYLTLDGTLMAVSIGEGSTPAIGVPAALFKAGFVPSYNLDHFIPSADGQRFLFKLPPTGRDESVLNVVVNWAEALPK